MYYPYLRARQFELIALRELANEGALENRVIPIFEPVKKTFNNFDIAFKIFSDKNQKAYIIINPEVGELANIEGYRKIAEYVQNKAEIGDIFRPAFHYNDSPGRAGVISAIIENSEFTNCLLICKSDIDYNAPSFDSLIKDDRITFFNIDDPGRSRGLVRKIKATGKGVIRLDDLFDPQQRNSDYLQITEHRFSEEHMFYSGEGFSGFSDFTILSSVFSEGGSTPRAVAIHLTYLGPNNEIWIRHFTSDTNDSIVNVQGKFKEAAEKAVKFCRANGLTNSAIAELTEYFDLEHYPGLGTVKKISIKNHILLLSEYLRLNP